MDRRERLLGPSRTVPDDGLWGACAAPNVARNLPPIGGQVDGRVRHHWSGFLAVLEPDPFAQPDRAILKFYAVYAYKPINNGPELALGDRG